MKPSFFYNSEKEQRLQAKAACGSELVRSASAYVDAHAQEITQRGKEAGLNDQETEEFLQNVKQAFEKDVLKEYLEKAEEIDKKLEEQALNRDLSPK